MGNKNNLETHIEQFQRAIKVTSCTLREIRAEDKRKMPPKLFKCSRMICGNKVSGRFHPLPSQGDTYSATQTTYQILIKPYFLFTCLLFGLGLFRNNLMKPNLASNCIAKDDFELQCLPLPVTGWQTCSTMLLEWWWGTEARVSYMLGQTLPIELHFQPSSFCCCFSF